MDPLVGRDVPLAAADAAIGGAARGCGALVLVSGDAGIGKSRLVQEITQRAVSRGMTRAYGFAVDDPGAPPAVALASGASRPTRGAGRNGRGRV